jgi:hypothetical protein
VIAAVNPTLDTRLMTAIKSASLKVRSLSGFVPVVQQLGACSGDRK